MIPVVCPTYLPKTAYFGWMVEQKTVHFVSNTHYQKQTCRNRTSIYGANGKLNLTIPIVHKKKQNFQKEDEVKIAYDMNWQKQHWKSLCSAYRSSPYFEFYESELSPFFEKKTDKLFSLNIHLIELIMQLIELPFQYKIVTWNPQTYNRLDELINAKKEPQFNQEYYTQVFESKLGFIANLSILDVLFNLGPNTSTYLKKQVSKFD